MPSKNPTIQKAYKAGTISEKQYQKLPDKSLLGIIKKKVRLNRKNKTECLEYR